MTLNRISATYEFCIKQNKYTPHISQIAAPLFDQFHKFVDGIGGVYLVFTDKSK